ncbi:HIT family protein [Halobacteriovorax marinus]|uniref:HIT-family protein n=1 Tax=Halobacteriovorax marinus (strain ATCC BAA-682 / DSM 15412 / SJ) TaxID=862908 RepID=E1WYI6_HALMS|nr:HIT family protein [Halobacteriovorax marinus]ATH07410.1 HIT family protein [Halobacteriovorax marinus]CBW26034.1 putative HIT-family protein [Halobacteriovorax marinus SJ]
MDDCIFCKILKGESPASFVYRNDKVSAFMDLNPINKGHVLVIPNEHHKRFAGVDNDTVGEMFKVAQKILKSIESSSIACEGANLFVSDGEVAGQEPPHTHLHITPRFKGDGYRMGFSGTDADESSREKLDETAEIIKSAL